MAQMNELITTMKSVDYEEKKQFLEYLVRLTERTRLSRKDADALLSYAYEETENLLRAIPEAETYKRKDLLFQCEDFLMGIVIHLTGSADKLPPDQQMKLRALAELVDRERYLERTLDEVFVKPSIGETDINRLLYWTCQTTDEYQKSKLFLGLVHYREDMGKLEEGARRILTAYIHSELHRLMALDSEDTWNALELLADVCRQFGEESITAALLELVKKGRNHINFYAVETLLTLGCTVPDGVISALAGDLEYACLTYEMLNRTGNGDRFPKEYSGEEYLAKSDLVHWLTFPSELGKAPDDIVYIGKIRQLFKREVFHVFKFRSSSDTLDEERKNKWLIGWSSNQGGTFSNFDEFAAFEMETTEKTLKLIKKKLIG